MVAEQDMIEPFESGQVRHDGDRKLISYGTSSYGYDVRCSNEFKIFTNINTTIVDPKNFDARSLVDFVGVAQFLFFESDEVCETSYKDRAGKYQGQRGVTLPKT